MPLSPTDWQQRFSLQAKWTRQTRQYLLKLAHVTPSQTVLDVGCGTGAISKELSKDHQLNIYGLDINFEFLNIAVQGVPSANFILGDGQKMPFHEGTFNLTFCHFLLLWVERPVDIINEMLRVTVPGGAILFLAEPDYGGRIDFPEEFTILGEWQQSALRRQGADPLMGRQLSALLDQAGLQNTEVGVIGAQWNSPPTTEELASEWEIIRSDLEYLNLSSNQVHRTEVLNQADYDAWSSGVRTLFVPTFYALGWVPS